MPSTPRRRERERDDEQRHRHALIQLQQELVAALTDDVRAAAAGHGQGPGSVATFQRTVTRLVGETLDATRCTFEPDVPPETPPHADELPLQAARHDRIGVAVWTGETVHGVVHIERVDGRRFDSDDLAFSQEAARLLATAIDHDAAQRRLQQLALYDSLTGLPNRGLLLDRLEHALQRVEREGGCVGLLFLDLDCFKEINDTFGHTVGDATLAAAAQRLQGTLRPTDTIGRLGGDEFAVVCEAIQDEADALLVAERLHNELSTPLVVDGHQLLVTASIGVAIGGPGADPNALYRDADHAMYEAKARGRNRVWRFEQRRRRELGIHLGFEKLDPA